LKGSDIAIIKSTKEELTKASHKLAEAVYKASQAQNAQNAAQHGGPQQNDGQKFSDEGKVVDAEVVDDNKDKK